MNSNHPPKKPTPAPISAADFPALRSFLRGYFHQDMKDEYGSPEEAVREFCEDASAEERAQVAKEWAKFLDQTNGQPLEEVNRLLTGPLGSSCSLTNEEMLEMTSALSRTTRGRRNRA
jgi:contact-dependent growth inhibition (CDI) system CdiI-like immunity protein